MFGYSIHSRVSTLRPWADPAVVSLWTSKICSVANSHAQIADVKNIARGHEVEKHHSEGKNVRRTLHTCQLRIDYFIEDE